MRVIDHRRKPQPESKKRSRKPAVWFVALAVAVAGGYGVFKTQKTEAPSPTMASNPVAAQAIEPVAKKGTLKQFTGEQFKDLYNNFAYPNTARINEDTPITGNEAADKKIREIAIARGYQVRAAPVTSAFVDVGGGFQLQQRAAQPWLDLVAAAQKDGITLGLTAAYRSADEQKQIFTSRLGQLGIPVAAIPSGQFDAQISQVLAMTAIPGFSRHHTGYTVDISCDDMPNSSFAYTTCFKWLSANNYEHAKAQGWIPSYPAGSGKQGPDPESWEYVWVGKDVVTE